MKRKLFSMLLALALCIGLIPMSAFAAETGNASYVLPEGVTAESFGNNQAVAIQEDGSAVYYVTVTAALEAKCNTLYLKPGSDVSLETHTDIEADLTLYANGANFKGQDMAFGGENQNRNVTIYNSKNLYLWGYANTDVTRNITMVNCENTGTGRDNSISRLVYLSGTAGVTNITVDSCEITQVDSPIYSNAPGEIVIKDSTFTECAVPVNMNFKATSGTMNATVSGCTFTSCGSTDATIGEYAAPIRFVKTGSEDATLNLTVSDCNITETVGNNGDVLLTDTREGRTSYPVEVELQEGLDVVSDCDNTGHSYGEWIATTPAECATDGIKTRTCAWCGESEEESIPATGIHTEVVDAAVEATYTSTGLTEGSHCSVCGKVLIAQKEIPKLVEATNDSNEPAKDNDSTSNESPKTGDNSNMILWFAIMMAAIGGIAACLLTNKRRMFER